MKIKKSKIYQMIILAVVVLGAIFLRFSPLLEQRDYWYDEAFTGVLMRQDFSTMNQYILDDVHPPLYYWLVKPWATLGDNSPFAIRSFSAVFGVLTVISVFWIGRKMYGFRAGLLASIFTAFTPFSILYSQEARMYALFGFLMLWAVWFFYLGLKKNQTKDWVLWGIFGGLSFYTHYLALFFFLAFFITFVLYNYFFQRKKVSCSCKIIGFFKSINFFQKGFWIGTGVIFLFFASWLKFMLGHLARKTLGWVEKADLSDIPETIQYFFFSHVPGRILAPVPNEFRSLEVDFLGIKTTFGPFFDGSSFGLLIFSFILVGFILTWFAKKNQKENLILAILAFGTLLILVLISWFGIKLYIARYFLPIAILVYLLLAGLIVGVFKKKYAWLVGLTIYVLALLLLRPIEYRTGWHDLMRSGKLDGADKVIIDNPFDYTSGKYYLGKEKARMYNRYDPNQDFSLWIIIDGEDIIRTTDEVAEFESALIVDDEDCNWDGINLEEIGDYGNLKLCRVKK